LLVFRLGPMKSNRSHGTAANANAMF